VALVRVIEGVGLELRFEWDGELRVSQVFKAWEALEEHSREKEGIGITGLALNCCRRPRLQGTTTDRTPWASSQGGRLDASLEKSEVQVEHGLGGFVDLMRHRRSSAAAAC
jgi:hypothetical protein